jgi:thiol-disulfide isomerase/thioredoxin
VEIITMVTPTCPYCPYAVLTANMFAYESGGRVISEVVEANEQMDIADLYQVTAVPAVVLKAEDQDTGNLEFIGVPPEADLLRKVVMYSNKGVE